MNILPVILSILLCFGAIGCATGSAGDVGMQGHERSTGQSIVDGVILSKVKTLLVRDPDVSGLDINVDVYSGVVTLRGYVNSESEAQRAIRLAQGVANVKQVQSRLVLDGSVVEVY